MNTFRENVCFKLFINRVVIVDSLLVRVILIVLLLVFPGNQPLNFLTFLTISLQKTDDSGADFFCCLFPDESFDSLYFSQRMLSGFPT